MPTSTPRILPGLGFIKAFFGAGTDGWDADMDKNLLGLSVLVNLRVLNRITVASMPSTPANGDIYIITDGANANAVAVRDNSTWVYLPAFSGWRAFDVSIGRYVFFNGTAWVEEATGLTLLDTKTASNSSTLDFTSIITSAYDTYEFDFSSIKASTGTGGELAVILSTDNGSSWVNSGGQYARAGNYSSNVSTTIGPLNVSGVNSVGMGSVDASAARYRLNGKMRLENPLSSASAKTFDFETNTVRSDGFFSIRGSGLLDTTTPVNAARFFVTSGLIASGVIRAYGVKK